MAKDYDFIKVVIESSTEIWGDVGHVFVSKEALLIMTDNPSMVTKDVYDQVIEKSKDLGKEYHFGVLEETHPDLGEGFRIYWEPVIKHD